MHNKIVSAWDVFDRNHDFDQFFANVKAGSVDDVTREDLYEDGESDSGSEEEEEADPPAPVQHDPVNPCKVCFGPINGERWCIIPCGHAPFCSGCIETVMNGLPADRARRTPQQRKCPVCRELIHNKIRIFL